VRSGLIIQNSYLKLLFSPVLLPASALYAVGLVVDRWLKRPQKTLPVPVISIGNLTLGGTGKTPALLRLVSDLRSMNRRPFILTRGYAGAGQSVRSGIVRNAQEADGFSDEVKLMADMLPGTAIGAGPNRVASAEKILAQKQENVAVLDDGFQHWKLARNLDVVCVDATDPWGGGFLFPFGRLREPVSSLGRADIVLITRCERVSSEKADEISDVARRHAPLAAVIRSRFEMKIIATDGKPAPSPERALALSAIGNPEAFEANLQALGVKTVPLRYPDHHQYTDDDLAYISACAQGAPVITTAKDWVKLRDVSFDAPVFIAAQSLSFEPGGLEAWRSRIIKSLGAA
jgi:tetraacyldisaccharide 4'-kinase